MPPKRFIASADVSSGIATNATAAGVSTAATSVPDSLVHRIDPDHYKAAPVSSPLSHDVSTDDDDDDSHPIQTESEPEFDEPILNNQSSSHTAINIVTAKKSSSATTTNSSAIRTSTSNPSSSSSSSTTSLASVSRRALNEASSGLGGSIFSACCVYPIDLVKTRLQLPNSPYDSLFGGMAQIAREEGIATLYTGLSSELLKSSVQSFSYFYWYYIFKEMAMNSFTKRDSSTANDSISVHDMALLSPEDLEKHKLHCTNASCFCRSVTHLAAHTEAHKLRASQVEFWRAKAESRKRKQSALRRAMVVASTAEAFDHNIFHPKLMPSVSEPNLFPLGYNKHDMDDSPYVDVKSTEHTSLVTNTATVIPPPSSSTSKTASGSNSTVSPPATTTVATKQPQQLSIAVTLLLGTLAGCITQLFVNPVSVIQTRMMTQKKSAGSVAQIGFFSIASSIYRDEGAHAFFAGILPAFILSTNPSIQFLVFDRMKSLILRILSQSMLEPRSLSMFESFIIGAFSKVVATLVTYPYIMAKLRLSVKGSQYKGTLDVIFRTLKYEGVAGLFAGLQAQLLKSVLGAALMFMFKEKLADLAAYLQKLVHNYKQKQLPPPAADKDTPVTKKEQ